MTHENSPERPVRTFRARRGISAAIWENRRDTPEGETILDYSIRFEKRFKSKETGEWQSSKSFFAADLPHLELVVRKAFEYATLKSDENARRSECASPASPTDSEGECEEHPFDEPENQ